MPGLAVLDPVTAHVLVATGGIAVDIAGVIAAAREVEMVIGSAFLVVEARAGADEAHGVAATAQAAGVGFAAVHDAPVVQAGVVGLEFEGDGFRLVALLPGDFRG